MSGSSILFHVPKEMNVPYYAQRASAAFIQQIRQRFERPIVVAGSYSGTEGYTTYPALSRPELTRETYA